MIGLTSRATEILCRARKIESLLKDIEREMDAISSQDLELESLMPKLTEREMEILTLLTQGKNMHEISTILGIEHRTTQAHRWNIQQKLKLSSSKDIMRIVVPWMQKNKTKN